MKIGAQPIERLPQLNEADAYGLVTIPIFDPYRSQRQQPYLGVEIPGGSPIPLATASGGIAYFHEDTQLHDKVLDGLVGSKHRYDGIFRFTTAPDGRKNSTVHVSTCRSALETS